MSKIPIYSAKEQTSRRHAGTSALMATVFSLGLAAIAAAPAAAQETKPNILFIMGVSIDLFQLQ
jgi:ABC-type sugar transport system substrate-binding protein